MRLPALPCLLPLALAMAPGAAWASEPVTVYRCVDARGHVTIGDVPCAEGSAAQVREMQRPRDGEAAARPATVEAAAAAPALPPQVVVVRTPAPMYECVTPEGSRYTSDTADGNPRWVPLWTLGHRGDWRGRPRPDASRGEAREAGSPWGRVGAPPPRPEPPQGGHRPPRPGQPGHGHVAYGGGTWVRDTCRALPQGEVCARLVDRRDEIRRRFFNAQERERDTLRVEERGINERLAADCGRR